MASYQQHSFANCWASDMYDAPMVDEMMPLPQQVQQNQAGATYTQKVAAIHMQQQQQNVFMAHQKQQQVISPRAMQGWASLFNRMGNANVSPPQQQSPPGMMVGTFPNQMAGAGASAVLKRRRNEEDVEIDMEDMKLRRVY